MSALGDLLHSGTQLGEAAIDHLQALVGEWALLSDLSFADLLLLVAQRGGEEFLVVAQVRPGDRSDGLPERPGRPAFHRCPATRRHHRLDRAADRSRGRPRVEFWRTGARGGDPGPVRR